MLRSEASLSEALVEMGAVASPDIERVLENANPSYPGTLDAVAGEIGRCVVETSAAGVLLMPVGRASTTHSAEISPESLDRLIQQVRPAFDLILIDTGPVMGSPEATSVAAAADGVVMIVSRGEQRPLAQKAFERLETVGADVVGIVFNRAQPRDLESSGYSSRVSGRSTSAGAKANVDQDKRAKYADAGPVAGAVASAKWTNDHGGSNGS